MTSKSSSKAQQIAEAEMRKAASDHLGVPLEPEKIQMADGVTVQVDAVSRSKPILAEIYARISDTMATSQMNKMLADAAKIAWIRDNAPDFEDAKCYLIVNASSKTFGERTWRKQVTDCWSVEILPVEVPEQTAILVEKAQLDQLMVSAPDETD